MPDKITLLVNDQKIENFQSYTVESNIFEAADAFSLTLASPKAQIQRGGLCQLQVNGVLELTGIIDRPKESYDKRSHTLTVEGRDLMGLLVGSCVENKFETLEGKTLQELAEQLLAKIPFIDRKKIIYGKGSKTQVVPLSEQAAGGIFHQAKDFMQIEPGDTIFEVLKRYALADGLLFFSLPDGTFVFGEPLTSGTASYTLKCLKNGKDNNIISGTRTDDISGRFKKVKVIGQQQGTELSGPGDTEKSGEVEDAGFPFTKTFVTATDVVGVNPKAQAKLIMDRQKFEGFQLEYKVAGHSQGGKNYQPNTIIHVIDEMLKPPILGKDFLVYARTFERSKTDGTTTTLKLSELGVLPA